MHAVHHGICNVRPLMVGLICVAPSGYGSGSCPETATQVMSV